MLVISGLFCDFSLSSKPQNKPHKPTPPAHSRYAQLKKTNNKRIDYICNFNTKMKKMKNELWNTKTEKQFFKQALNSFATPEQLFYKFGNDYLAYVPKGQSAKGQALQSRNSLIGQFTEKWCTNLLQPIAKKIKLHAVTGVICNEIGLSKQSNADLAFCTTNDIEQPAENIKMIFEVKMSITSNYQYFNNTKELNCLGDYNTHKGNPSILRSDSMLKAIGKAINIRVSGISSTKIPIIILGNSPITKSYLKKVDFLQKYGVIQNFLSLNPKISDKDFIKLSEKQAFTTIEKYTQLEILLTELIENEINYFSSMISKPKLGEIITIANKEKTNIKKAERFLELIRS